MQKQALFAFTYFSRISGKFIFSKLKKAEKNSDIEDKLDPWHFLKMAKKIPWIDEFDWVLAIATPQ